MLWVSVVYGHRFNYKDSPFYPHSEDVVAKAKRRRMKYAMVTLKCKRKSKCNKDVTERN